MEAVGGIRAIDLSIHYQSELGSFQGTGCGPRVEHRNIGPQAGGEFYYMLPDRTPERVCYALPIKSRWAQQRDTTRAADESAVPARPRLRLASGRTAAGD